MVAEEQTSLLQEWAEVTTAHGFFDFSRAKSKLGKILWFIIIFICLLIMYYQLNRGINDFNKHEWKTSIDEKQNTRQNFPSLILCNVNRLKYSKMIEYEMALEMVSYLFYSINTFTGYIAKNATVVEEEADFIAWRKSKNFSYMDIFDKMASTCEDMFVNATFCEIPGYITISPIDTFEYGRCVQLAANSTLLYSSAVGTMGGMTIALRAQFDEYLPLVYNNHWGAGIALQLSYSGVAELGQWTILNPGKRTSVAMSVTQTTVRTQDRIFLNPFTLIDSQPPCAKNPSMRFSGTSHYSLLTCQIECTLLFPYTLCNCIPQIQRDGYRTCEAEENLKCMNLTTQSAAANPVLLNETNACIEQCQPLCYDTYVETQTTITDFPSAKQSSEFDRYLATEKIDATPEEMIILDVYFASLATKVVEQYEVVTLDDLISSSGGLIGLWCGMSFITVFQAFEYFVMFLKRWKQKRETKTKLKSLPPKSLIYAINKGKGK